MQDAFLFKIVLSFLTAGIWITAMTILAERFGSKIGGIIGNMPSNILISLLFMGWTQSPEFAAEATTSVPLGMAFDAFFLFAYIVSAKRLGTWAALPAFACWFILAFLFSPYIGASMLISTLIFAIITLVLFFILDSVMKIRSVQAKQMPKTLSQLAMRALFAGLVVASSVALAAFLGPFWGGILSVFPAVLFSTMHILTVSQGADFSRATGKVLLLASSNIIIYAFAVRITYPLLGLVLGTIVSYAVVLIAIAAAYPLLKRIS